MRAKRRAADLPAIDASLICDAALRLTKEFGIDGWSIRQLAKEIDARPNVINYHVGRREDVVHLVMERVNAEISLSRALQGLEAVVQASFGGTAPHSEEISRCRAQARRHRPWPRRIQPHHQPGDSDAGGCRIQRPVRIRILHPAVPDMLLRRRRGRQGPARRGAQRDGQGVRWCPFHARTRRCRPGEGRQAPDRERKPETGFLRPSVFGPCRCSSRRTGRKPSARSTDMPRTRAFKTPRSRPKF